MEAYSYCVSTVPSDNAYHPIECAPSSLALKSYFLGEAGDTGDERFHDMGILTIATEGMQAADVKVGELWCTYEIELMKPKLSGAPPALVTHYHTTTAISANDPFGINLQPAPWNSIEMGITPETPGGGDATLDFTSAQSGVYRVIVSCKSTAGVFPSYTDAYTSHFEPLDTYYTFSTGSLPGPEAGIGNNGTGVIRMFTYRYQSNTQLAYIDYSCAMSGMGTTEFEVIVERLDVRHQMVTGVLHKRPPTAHRPSRNELIRRQNESEYVKVNDSKSTDR
jgi:hypothetical protein